MDRLYSGMQPTGAPHVGNYLGAIRSWVELAARYDAIYGIVDLHALTVAHEPAELQARVRTMAAVLLGCGLPAPDRCSLYVQSNVPQHAELAWVFATVTPLAELYRMTQFKDKARVQQKNVNAGLLTYPVLQAADILLYKGTVVPVGEDQVQHIEMSRIIARKFNNRYGELFPEPKELVVSRGARIMGLDGQAKMSKSLGNHLSLLETPEDIREKLKTAFTDPDRKRRKDPGNPEVCNMWTLHRAFSTDEQVAWAAQGCRTAEIGCFECKKVLADNLIDHLAPIRERTEAWLARPADLDELLAEGSRRCRCLAAETLGEVYERLGLRPARQG
ncbi:MAG: tryptophan--tRNA ligase [Deltaproteobacteria bacterium]|nr:tryptophan--tRNA ligase [Deltaproteobacteria bacterium]